MWILKNKTVLINYVLPIVLLPFIAIILEIFLKVTFNLGGYFGAFIRGLFELVWRNI